MHGLVRFDRVTVEIGGILLNSVDICYLVGSTTS